MRDFHKPGRSPVIAANALCATSHPLPAQVAIETLRNGGNAMDAAIAGAVLLGLCQPHSTGIGGDCFVLVKPSGSEDVFGLNGSGRAPAGLTAAMLRDQGLDEIGIDSVHSVTVPGAIDAFCTLAADWGRLGIGRCLAPAIHYAETGIPVAPRVAYDWANNAARLKGMARDWYLDRGAPPQVGRIWRHPGQAEVLRRVARDGRAAFYQGEVADDMLAVLQSLGGAHRAEDFVATRSDYTTPISGSYRGLELLEHAPNSQGATAILMAHILDALDLGGLDPFGAARTHLEAEAAKLAYDAAGRFLADPAYMSRLDHMLAPDTGRALAALIDPARAMTQPARVAEAVHRDTVYLSVVDQDRMAVSMIYSTFWPFGSGICSEKFGILLQNRGAGFTLRDGHPNQLAPGKRPMHTIIPAMLRQSGRVVMPYGVMGGAYQPTGHIRVLSNLVDFGMDVQEALDGPRSFAFDGKLALEGGYRPQIAADLAAMGHDCIPAEVPFGAGQAVWIDHDLGVLVGGSDPRKDGLALGY